MNLTIEVAEASVAPGAWVRGRVHGGEGGRCRELTVSLVFREKSPALAYAARETDPVVLHTGDVPPGRSWEFTVQLPDDALPTYRSQYSRLDWLVVANVDRAGLDASEVYELKVS